MDYSGLVCTFILEYRSSSLEDIKGTIDNNVRGTVPRPYVLV